MSSEVKRVAVFGTESTGKTWLAEHLARHFGEPWVPEYAREFWDQNGGVIGLEHMVPIAREQWRREDEIAARAKRVLICDTDSLTTMLWSDVLYGTCPEEVRRGAEKRAKNYALYLLLDVDIPFAPDPQRCFPDSADREKLARVWRGALLRRELPFVEIRGDWATREKAAVAAVESLLARKA